MNCADCDESLDQCVVCSATICPAHRSGHGSTFMWYTCFRRPSNDYPAGSTCALMALGPPQVGGVHREQGKLSLFFERYGLVNVLAAVFLVGWALIGLVHFILR